MSEQLTIPVNEIQPDSTLMSLGADSLDGVDGVELLMAMEEEFGIEISDDSIEKYSTATVGQIACDLEFHLTLNSDPAVAGILPDDQAAYHMGVVDGSREYVIDAGMNIFNPKYLIADVNGADSSAHDAYIRGYVFGYTS
jgi:acyl carrier protein